MEGIKLTQRGETFTSQPTDLTHIVRNGVSMKTQVGNMSTDSSVSRETIGGVTYLGGMNYYVYASRYTIDSVTYNTFVSGTVTLADGGAQDRFDIFVVQVTGGIGSTIATIEVVEGTEAANPVYPSLNLETQTQISFVSVEAGDTSNSDINTNVIYDENVGEAGGEWDNTDDSSGSNFNYAVDPYSGVKSYRNDAASNDVVSWTADQNFTFDESDKLVFAFKGSLVETSKITFKLINSATDDYWLNTMLLSNLADYGYNNSLIGWQVLSAKFSEFVNNTPSNTIYDRLELTLQNTPVIDIDRIFTQTVIGGEQSSTLLGYTESGLPSSGIKVSIGDFGNINNGAVIIVDDETPSAVLQGVSNAETETAGDTSIVTKGYGDATYLPQGLFMASDQVLLTGFDSFVDATSASFSCISGVKYRVEVLGQFTNLEAAYGAGFGFRVATGAGTINGTALITDSVSPGSNSRMQPITVIGSDNTDDFSYIVSQNQDEDDSTYSFGGVFIFNCTTTGVFHLTIASETNSNPLRQITFKAGSGLIVNKIN